jgi:hypothetical protein
LRKTNPNSNIEKKFNVCVGLVAEPNSLTKKLI